MAPSGWHFSFRISSADCREGALGIAYLPVYSEMQSSNRDHAGQLASPKLGALVVVLGTIVVVGESVLFLFFSMGDDNSTVLC